MVGKKLETSALLLLALVVPSVAVVAFPQKVSRDAWFVVPALWLVVGALVVNVIRFERRCPKVD